MSSVRSLFSRSLAVKLILAFLGVGLAVSGLVAVFAGQFTANAFGAYIFNQNQENLASRLADYYRLHGDWEGVGEAMHNLFDPQQGGDPALQLVDGTGHILAGRPAFPPGQVVSANDLARGVPIEVDGVRVGTLVRQNNDFGLPPRGASFLGRINEALIGATIGAALLALLLGWLLARAFTQQLRELNSATRKIAEGELGQQVAVRSRDEIGQLAESFNKMSTDLARSRDIRRQMTADIAHELRTPLSIILGHTEALRDGVIPATSETHALLHDEAVRLNRLVEDLRILSLADAGELSLNRREIAPGALLERVMLAHAPQLQQKGLRLETVVEPNLPTLQMDPDRMTQVLNNLVDNAARHTPEGGLVRGEVKGASGPAGDKVLFSVSDTGPGIAAEDLPNVFERFYRADKARQHDANGSGLGLAIARSIVEAHGGRIWVESQDGARFFIEIPVSAVG